MAKQIHTSSRISGKFCGLIEKNLKDKDNTPFVKHCFSLEVKTDGERLTHPFFEIKETMLPFLAKIEKGDYITVGFNPDCKGWGTGNELSINRAFWVEAV
tara:strand:+ start:67 stop:366 length:300 start_codon:yes stop_codon:yes gene_type:complete